MNWRDEIYEISNAVRRLPKNIPRQNLTVARHDHLDLARGIAIVLMILSHTVMALNTFQTLDDFAIVPMHTITKFSSSLFILVFGVTLARFYLSAIGTQEWPHKRNRLLWRAFMVLVWYKILTIVQMFEAYSWKDIWLRLKFQEFTDYAEVLNFYWLALIWICMLLPIWRSLSKPVQLISIIVLGAVGVGLERSFDFWGVWQLKAMLVEHPEAFCFGQFQRGALALLGLWLGGLFLLRTNYDSGRRWLGMVSLAIAAACFATFGFLLDEASGMRQKVILAISKNYGKHPPNLYFSLFSGGGAAAILGLCLLLPQWLTKLLHPLRLIGQEAFFCFNLHFFIIFILYRYFLDLRLKVSYNQSLWLFGGVVLAVYLLAPINMKLKRSGVLWKWGLP